MTTEEKIKHIKEVTLLNTQADCDRLLDKYKAHIDRHYNDKMEEAEKKAELKIKATKEDIIKKAKKECANEQLRLKRKISNKQMELKNILKDEIKKQLVEFAKTEEYMMMLEKQIKEILDFAMGNSVNIYLDANDADKKEILESKTNCTLTIFKKQFLGGTMAEIPVKNIWIDNSFESKLDGIMEDYTFKV